MSRVKCKRWRSKFLEEYLDFCKEQDKNREMIKRINGRLKKAYGPNSRIL